MSERNVLVLICRSYQAAEQAVHLLQAGCFNVAKVSIVGRDYYGLGAGAPGSAKDGKFLLEVSAFWCRMWNLLSGDAFFKVEGIGSFIVAGEMSQQMRAASTNPLLFHAYSPLRACMHAIGITNGNLVRYEMALRSDQFLVIVHGNQAEIVAAGSILQASEKFSIARDKHSASVG